jgi:Fe2+ transport system protein FeoA
LYSKNIVQVALRKGNIMGHTNTNINSGINSGIITKIRGNVDFHRKLVKLGLFNGSMINIVNPILQSDPIRVHVNGDRLELSREEAAGISIDFLGKG